MRLKPPKNTIEYIYTVPSMVLAGYCAPHVFWSLRTTQHDFWSATQRGADYAKVLETCRCRYQWYNYDYQHNKITPSWKIWTFLFIAPQAPLEESATTEASRRCSLNEMLTGIRGSFWGQVLEAFANGICV